MAEMQTRGTVKLLAPYVLAAVWHVLMQPFLLMAEVISHDFFFLKQTLSVDLFLVFSVGGKENNVEINGRRWSSSDGPRISTSSPR